jgi:signal transduction histidine kinase/CheY-like chemotaxis protein
VIADQIAVNSNGASSLRALVLAPNGRDATLSIMLLKEAGFAADICRDLGKLNEELHRGAGMAIIADEALQNAELRPLVAFLEDQPAWSDLPIILLTHRGGGPDRNPAALRLAAILGNVSFLERPFHATTLTTMARAAARGRRRQYDARGRLEEISEREQQLETALTAGRLGSWSLDVKSMAFHLSETSRSHFGSAAGAELPYGRLIRSVHPDDRPRMNAALDLALKSGDDYVTRTLEQRVVERTGELVAEVAAREKAQEQLLQAQKMESVGQLTGGIAHDFNNLLMAVMGNLEILRKRLPDDPSIRRLIDGARQGAQRGASLTQRMLAFARQQDLRTTSADLGTLVRGMQELLRRSLGPNNELRLHIEPNLPPAEVDAHQVELAILNLAINARDAMPDGGVIELRVDQKQVTYDFESLRPGTYLRIQVADTGVGMDQATLRKAIEPFFSTKPLGKGTGLGLSMTHGLAVQLGGLLELDSEISQGTTATLWLPQAIKPAGKIEAVAAPASFARTATILVVDDDPLIATSTVDMLEDLGHTVIGVNSGAHALQIINDGKRLDLLMTDQAMPGMTGIQLAEIVHRVRPELPVLLATGYTDLPAGNLVNLPRLSKPYQQAQLQAEIEKLLGIA